MITVTWEHISSATCTVIPRPTFDVVVERDHGTLTYQVVGGRFGGKPWSADEVDELLAEFGIHDDGPLREEFSATVADAWERDGRWDAADVRLDELAERRAA